MGRRSVIFWPGIHALRLSGITVGLSIQLLGIALQSECREIGFAKGEDRTFVTLVHTHA